MIEKFEEELKLSVEAIEVDVPSFCQLVDKKYSELLPCKRNSKNLVLIPIEITILTEEFYDGPTEVEAKILFYVPKGTKSVLLNSEGNRKFSVFSFNGSSETPTSYINAIYKGAIHETFNNPDFINY